jgi:hypothetical protein
MLRKEEDQLIWMLLEFIAGKESNGGTIYLTVARIKTATWFL